MHTLFKPTCVKRTRNDDKNLAGWWFRRMRYPSSTGAELVAPGFACLCTSFPSKAETHASEASQMAVRSWPPSRARTMRPPARPISCFVRYPKPVTREKRKNEEMQEKGKGGGWNQTPGEGSKNYRKELHHIKKPQGIWKDSTHNISQVGF